MFQINTCERDAEDVADDASLCLAMELWLRLGRPVKLPAPATPDAKALRGLCLREGYDPGLPEDPEQGLSLIREAAAHGCVHAWEYLWWAEIMQPETEAELAAVTAWAGKAARAGRAEALVSLLAAADTARHHGPSFTKELADTISQLVPFDREASWYRATDLADTGKHLVGMAWATQAVADGSKLADYELALCFLGLGQRQEAITHLRAGANKGDSRCAITLIDGMEADAELFLEVGMHRDRYVKISVADGNASGMKTYAEGLFKRNNPGDAVEACRALLALQYSDHRLEWLEGYGWDEVALWAYPQRRGRVPLAATWDWLFDRLATATYRGLLLDYGYIWEDYAFNPDRRKEWLYLDAN